MSGGRARLGRSLRSRWLAVAILVAAVAAWIALMWLALGGHDDTDAFVETRTPPGLPERFYPPEGWAWGLLQVGDAPPQRYGVAGSPGPRAQVLILPDYGESAETWFETARDLGDAGVTVWVLEGVGQGGSARLGKRRDLGELKSFDGDVAAVRAMTALVIRPDSGVPLVILGQGQGAMLALRAAQMGGRPTALILSAPRCQGAGMDTAGLRPFGLGAQRVAGGAGWSRAGADDYAAHRTHDAWRGAVTHRWQFANPDLRMGAPSLDWLAAAASLRAQIRTDAAKIGLPILLIAPKGAPTCVQPAGASVQTIAGADPALELEDDAHRGPWLAAIEGFIADHTRAPIPPPLRVAKRDHAS